MDCVQYPLAEAPHFNPFEIHYSPKLTHKFTFTAELCGIWLGDLPFNKHLEATLLPVHILRNQLRTPLIPVYNQRSHRSNSTKTELPQRSSKKSNASAGFGTKLISTDSLQKSDSFDLPNEITRRLESCRITGSITFANGCLVFKSRDPNLKIPVHLGGPGDQDLLCSNSQSFDCGFSLNCGHLNSGTVFDLSYWAIENGTNLSCQSLLSSQSGCFSGGRKFWSSASSSSNLRKRGLKQFWTALLSKKSKQNRQNADIEASSIQTLATSEQTPSLPRETFRLEWPLTTLRQFAFNGYLFKMETGRRAPHGEGHYLFRIPDIAEFRQNLEAHIDHLKRSRTLKARSAVCYRSSPPSVPPPPPPPTSLTRAYANISPTLPLLAFNRSWTNLLQTAEEAGECFNLENDNPNWLIELISPPPPPLIQDANPTSQMVEQSQLARVGTYENVRNLLHSQETDPISTQSPKIISLPTILSNLELPSGVESTLNYALLDFQEPSINHADGCGNCGSRLVRSPQSRYSRRRVASHLKSNSCELLTRFLASQAVRRLARSVEARLNASVLEAEEQSSSSNGGNYVDICPLQTLAINELLRSTL